MLEDKYMDLGVIGKGATATVHKVGCMSTFKAFAVKKMNDTGDNFQDVCFDHELNVMDRLRGKEGVVQLVEALWTSNGENCFVMELLQGVTLCERIVQNRGLSEKEAVDIFRKIAMAVKSLHDVGIVHRDLKPGNIMYDSETGQVKLCDFGFAKIMAEDDIFDEYIVGTTAFLAPETRQMRYETASDIWSLGCILYIMLSCCYPFDPSDENFEENVQNCTFMPLTSRIGYPSEAGDFVSKMLKPIEERITIDKVLKHKWLRNAADYDKMLSEAMSLFALTVQHYEYVDDEPVDFLKARKVVNNLLVYRSIKVKLRRSSFIKTKRLIKELFPGLIISRALLNVARPVLSKAEVLQRLGHSNSITTAYSKHKKSPRKLSLCRKSQIASLSKPHIVFAF